MENENSDKLAML